MKNFFKNFLQWFLAIGFLLVLIFLFASRQGVLKNNFQTNNIQYVKIAGQTIKVNLALTPVAQEQGLSGRKNLAEDAGMLFIFDKPAKYSFWMKNMNFPIDIIWLSKDLRVVYLKKNALPESYPETFTPGADAEYVLEVVAGFSEKNNLKEGDSAEFLSF